MNAEILYGLQKKYGNPPSMPDALPGRYGASMPEALLYRTPGVSALERLSKKYGPPLFLLNALAKRYGDGFSGTEKADEPELKPVFRPLVFTDDARENQEAIDRILQAYATMESETLSIVGEQRGETYRKLLREYARKVEELRKYSGNGEKLAGKFQKFLKQTLLKLWGADTQDCLRRYFKACGIRSRDYEKGRRLSDDDLNYLDVEMTQAYIKTATRPEQDYEVIQMIRPILFIGYQEDGEEEQDTCIEGVCSYFVRKR